VEDGADVVHVETVEVGFVGGGGGVVSEGGGVIECRFELLGFLFVVVVVVVVGGELCGG